MFVHCKWCNYWSFGEFCCSDCESLFNLNLALEDLENHNQIVSHPQTLIFYQGISDEEL